MRIMSVAQHSEHTRNKIKQSLLETRQRRKSLQPYTCIVKIVDNKVKDKQKEKIIRCFLEAKWLKNHILAHDSIFSTSSTIKSVDVKMPDDTMDTRKLTVLGSHMKESLISHMKQDVYNLAKSKEKGHSVGALKYVKEVSYIPLKEYGNTYKINRKKSKVFVQKIGWLPVQGIDNIPDDVDYAHACLVNKTDGVYVHITAYRPSKERTYVKGTYVGIDMGLKTSLTLSTGEKFDMYVEEPDRLKKLRRKLSRQHKGSNNYVKTLNKINVIQQKMSRIKQDMAYKFVHDLSYCEHVFFQDEMLSQWKKRSGYVRGGKKIQCGILGRVKSLLRNKDWTTTLSQSMPTTQLCVCGEKNKHQLDERTYFCSHCGYTQDRDTHAAQNMIRIATSDKRYTIPSPQGLGITPVENIASTIHFNYIAESMASLCSEKQETNSSSVNW